MKHGQGTRLLLFGLTVIILEIVIGYLIVSFFVREQRISISNGQTQTVSVIKSNTELLLQTIAGIMLRNGAIFRINGKYLDPDTYSQYLQRDSNLLKDVVQSQRWIPRISLAEKSEFISYYGNFYDDFDIRRIVFVPNTGEFIITPLGNKTEYYPFALAEPPFTATVMGGDFSEFSGFNDPLLLSPITRTNRTAVAIDNNDRNFGILLYSTVRTDVLKVINLSQPLPPINNTESIIGLVSVLLIPQVLVAKAADLAGVDQRDYQLLILDPTVQQEISLIYGDTTVIPTDLREWKYIQIDLMDRPILIYFKFSREFNNQFKDISIVAIDAIYAGVVILVDLFIVFAIYNYYKKLEAERHNVYKNILTYINHELRNPLVPITGLVDMSIESLESIAKTSGSGLGLDLIISDLHTVRGHTQLIHYIIDDVLTYRKLKEGQLRTNPQILVFSEVFRDVHKTVRAKIRENPKVVFRTDLEDGLTLYADRFRVTQVILNLISNAIKFTNTGEIVIRGRLLGDMCHIEVQDSGSGVPAELTGRLFQEFVYDGGVINPSGSGLGLYICKNLVTLMGGTIGYMPAPERGSIFHFNLPSKPPVVNVLPHLESVV